MPKPLKFDHEYVHDDGSFTRILWRRGLGTDGGKACYVRLYGAKRQLKTVWQLVFDGAGDLVHTERKLKRV